MIVGDATTSVSNLANPAIATSVSPNPARDFVNVEFLNPTGETYQVSVFGVNGQQLQVSQSSDAIFRLDTSDLNTGMYFIRIDQGDKQSVQKLMIAR